MIDVKLEQKKRMVPIQTQKFVTSFYIFGESHSIRERFEYFFESFAEKLGTSNRRTDAYLKQFMVKPDYLVYLLEDLSKFSDLSDLEKTDVQVVIDKVKLMETIDPDILIDLEG